MIRGRRKCDEINGCGKFYKQDLQVCPSCGTPEAFSTLVPFNPLHWVYDLENYPNVFTASFKHPMTGSRAFSEVSPRRNDLRELVVFLNQLREAGCILVGYNNLGYDYPILHFILDYHYADLDNYAIFQKGDSIINTPWENRFNNVIPEWQCYIQQIDLLKIHHFDNQARHTSLKMLEFNMDSQNIEDLPFEPAVPIAPQSIPVLIKYNDHDVDETEKFYIESIEMIEFREELSARYQDNFTNYSDKKIGTALFISELEKNNPGCCYTKVNNRKVKRQTIRSSIALGDVIFPYINFKRVEFQRVKTWLQGQVITKTKGVFEYLDVSPVMAMSMNPDIIKVHGLTAADVPSLPPGKVSERMIKNGVILGKCRDDMVNRTDLDRFKFVSGWKDQSGLNTIVEGFQYDFGTGGIHGSIDSTIVYSDDDYVIFDWDVKGYYPTLGAVNNLYPEHLSSQFGVVDEMLKQERAKHKKGTPLNKAIKLARNGAYGDSNNQYSPFFDPQYTMSITINGQLLLCLLAENLIDIPGLQMIQINTDGLTVRCPRGYIDHMKVICKWWEDFTCLELESAVYSRMFIRDVNNYIAEYDKDYEENIKEGVAGKVKRKGAYEYKLEWHQNYSQRVVAKAAEAALVEGVDIEQFIRSHQNINDFMLRTKVGRADRLVITDAAKNERRLQNITRYYIGNHGGALTKISPPAKGYTPGTWKRATNLTDQYYEEIISELTAIRNGPVGYHHLQPHEVDVNGLPHDERINTKNKSIYEIRRTDFNSGWLVAPCNDIRDADRDNINYDYYIAETRKLVDPLIN